MKSFRSDEIAELRQKYPPGSRITLNHMNDPYHPVEPGMTGTLKTIDDAGTVHVAWDNGRTLGLIFGEDSFQITPPKIQITQQPLDERIQTAASNKRDVPSSLPETPER